MTSPDHQLYMCVCEESRSATPSLVSLVPSVVSGGAVPLVPLGESPCHCRCPHPLTAGVQHTNTSAKIGLWLLLPVQNELGIFQVEIETTNMGVTNQEKAP